MRHDDRDPSVEFLVSEPLGGVDEDLVPPTGSPLRRARLPLLVAGIVALVALIAVNIASSPGGTPAAGPRTVTPEQFHPAPRPTPRPSTLPSARATAAPTCPSQASCAVVVHTPKHVAAAVRHALPKVARLRTSTTFVHQDVPGSQLLFRVITGRVGSARLQIELRDAGPHDLLGWNASETAVRTLVTIRVHVRGRLVSLRLVGKPGFNDSIYAMRALAADPRLAAPAVRG